MGLIQATITPSNPRKPAWTAMTVEAWADSGPLHLGMPPQVAFQVDWDELRQREAAVGARRLRPYAGPIRVRFQNRACFTGAWAPGDEVLRGAAPMDRPDVVLSPARRAVIVNPDRPNPAASIVK